MIGGKGFCVTPCRLFPPFFHKAGGFRGPPYEAQADQICVAARSLFKEWPPPAQQGAGAVTCSFRGRAPPEDLTASGGEAASIAPMYIRRACRGFPPGPYAAAGGSFAAVAAGRSVT